MKSEVKVYGIFRISHTLPFQTEYLFGLYQFKDDAELELKKLNDTNDDPPEGDSWGYYSGTSYALEELEVK